GAGVLLLKAAHNDGGSRASLIALAVLYVSAITAVAFSANGMETGFLLLFLAWGMYLFERGAAEHWLAHGLCWAGLMWTRPDGCFYIAALVVANLAFARESRRPLLLGLAKSAGVCTVLYPPWFAGAWAYYGSPVPHTIRAKAGYEPDYTDWRDLLWHAYQTFPGRTAVVFQP